MNVLFFHITNVCKSSEWNKGGQGKLGFGALECRESNPTLRGKCSAVNASSLLTLAAGAAASLLCFLSTPAWCSSSPLGDAAQRAEGADVPSVNVPCCEISPRHRAVMYSLERSKHWCDAAHLDGGAQLRQHSVAGGREGVIIVLSLSWLFAIQSPF